MITVVKPLQDRILVRYLDDPEHLDSRVIALVKNYDDLISQAGKDPLGEDGDYRRVMRRAEVVAVGPQVDPDVYVTRVVYCAAWDDSEGFFGEEYAMIRQADIGLKES